MKLLRLCLCGTLAGGLLTGVLAIPPEWCDGSGVDFWNLPGLLCQLDRVNRQAAEIEAQARAANDRTAAKRQVTRELVAGRLTLRQAVARFQTIQQDVPGVQERLRLFYGGSDEERVAQQVIAWAEGEMRYRSPDRRDELLTRLQAELQAGL